MTKRQIEALEAWLAEASKNYPGAPPPAVLKAVMDILRAHTNAR